MSSQQSESHNLLQYLKPSVRRLIWEKLVISLQLPCYGGGSLDSHHVLPPPPSSSSIIVSPFAMASHTIDLPPHVDPRVHTLS
ncbi:hypothetical protein LguiA_021047 [Lonicera macranthoides]